MAAVIARVLAWLKRVWAPIDPKAESEDDWIRRQW